MASEPDVVYASALNQPSNTQLADWHVEPPTPTRPLTLVGPCPTCHDRCEQPVPDSAIAGGIPAGVSRPTAINRPVYVECSCLQQHRQPAGVIGCGRYWLGRVTFESDKYRLAAEENLALLPATAAAREAATTQDKRIQGAAEKWLVAVTTIYGLFSLTGVATAKDALSGLSAASKWVIAVALLGGLATAGLALLSGYAAAYGWPHTVPLTSDEELTKWYVECSNYAKTAVARLRKAIILSFCSLGVVTLVMLLTWFLPRHSG